ncbi:MAG TPA: radical SAM protein [Nitrospiraceae bacterium]|jgi:radical SAM protein with 4Fe4S-binding SPASM domain|nr:radical SAM protein [Nitrospiraceae bacterium]
MMRPPPPCLVYWELTKRCNLRCAHCRAVPEADTDPRELSTPEGFRLIDELALIGRPLLVFTGGEPLLRDDLFVLAGYARRRSVPSALATNGTLVSRAMAKRIVTAGFRRVSISLDGPNAETHDAFRRVAGAFDAAVDGFIYLKELGMSLQVNTTVTYHNRDQLETIYELVRKLGADAWHLFLLVPVGCGLEIDSSLQLTPHDYEAVLWWIDEVAERETMEIRATCAPHIQRVRLQRQALAGRHASIAKREASETEAQETRHGARVTSQTRRGCLAGSRICFVSHRGEVFPCGYLLVQAGDLRRQTFAQVWADSPVFADLRDPERLMGKCGRCEYRIVCGGCRARAFGRTGHYLGEEPACLYLPQPTLTG